VLAGLQAVPTRASGDWCLCKLYERFLAFVEGGINCSLLIVEAELFFALRSKNGRCSRVYYCPLNPKLLHRFREAPHR
jgi:hypothetical protein